MSKSVILMHAKTVVSWFFKLPRQDDGCYFPSVLQLNTHTLSTSYLGPRSHSHSALNEAVLAVSWKNLALLDLLALRLEMFRGVSYFLTREISGQDALSNTNERGAKPIPFHRLNSHTSGVIFCGVNTTSR